jgi:hypothetical protein
VEASSVNATSGISAGTIATAPVFRGASHADFTLGSTATDIITVRGTNVNFSRNVSAGGALTLTGTDDFDAGGNHAKGIDTLSATDARLGSVTVTGAVTAASATITGNASAATLSLSNVQWAATALKSIDGNIANLWMQTNVAAAHTGLLWTNYTAGQQFIVCTLGAASGGSDYNLTNLVQSGDLLTVDGAALATSATLTRTNGQTLELSGLWRKQNGTNVLDLITRRGTL